MRASGLKEITPGDSAGSRLIKRVEGAGGENRMPLGGKALEPEQIAILRKWIDEGARFGPRAARKSIGPT